MIITFILYSNQYNQTMPFLGLLTGIKSSKIIKTVLSKVGIMVIELKGLHNWLKVNNIL